MKAMENAIIKLMKGIALIQKFHLLNLALMIWVIALLYKIISLLK